MTFIVYMYLLDLIPSEKSIFFLDFDGVFVPNALIEDPILKLSEEKFAEYLKRYTVLNPFILHFLQILLKKKHIIYLVTGRKQSLLGAFTKELIANALNITLKVLEQKITFLFYPEMNNYAWETYWGWKRSVFQQILNESSLMAFAIDDDRHLLEVLKYEVYGLRFILYFYEWTGKKEKYRLF